MPVIAQEVGSNDVLMFAFMNREALAQRPPSSARRCTGAARAARLWHKGEESGHIQKVQELRLDCDNDVVLMKVEQLGSQPGIACHTGRHSCFLSAVLARRRAGMTVEPVLKDPESIYK